ncbi:MAG: 1-(5-phosphoribosyl)-5-[(5-phosphoribosylamino)methylideneamino]imidazole-4-carboxamide isomerase [Deltaproteobacteria bacterium]|nr:1-(5-phosphoribosyl)-5-[(5-phosphoribosylamino)methylideneamino]imidazole-4-carboxamide isomerase [Deltaproteobacteria bacterium]
MKIFPAIDLSEGKCVRLEQGRFDRLTVYGDDPVAMAKSFADAGATVLHVIDLDGARDEKARQISIIESIARNVSMAVQVGGGIRSINDVESYLNIGVSRVIIGSIVIRAPKTAVELFARFGAERIVFALDVKIDEQGTPLLATSGWSQNETVTLWQVLELFMPAGLRTVLCTDISRDGMLTGPNLDLYRDILSRYSNIELLASGGVSSLDDLRALKSINTSGVIVGKALYAGRFTLAEALAC